MNNFAISILNLSHEVFTVAVRTLKSKTYPYGPTRSDLRINPITKVIDRDITPENQEFLKNVVKATYEDLTKSPLNETPFSRGEWFPGVKRCGVIAKKIGSYPQWLKNGRKVFVTLLQVHDNHVINYLPPEKFAESLTCKSYWKGKFAQITVGTQCVDPRNFSTAYNGLFARAGVMPKAKLTRFVVSPQAAIQPGTPLFANHFKVGHFVDCEAKTIDHGFQGVMKRWGFKGGPKAHGNTKNHRRPGSFGGGKLGDRKSPGTVHKGTRMAGMMGAKFSCTRGLRIWRINTKHNVLYVHGYGIPGPINSWVRIFDTRIYAKSPHTLQEAPPFPTYYPEDQKEVLPENIYHPDLFDYEEPSIIYDNVAAKS